MHFTPLLSSDRDPQTWRAFKAVELIWTGSLNPGWTPECRRDLAVHALHFIRPLGADGLQAMVAQARKEDLGADFLVFPAALPGERAFRAALLKDLEVLLELCAGSGPRIVLRAAPGEAPGLVELLKGVNGHAVGFCWDGALGEDLDAVSDRILCAVAREGDDLEGLRALGYRWNVALPCHDSGAWDEVVRRLGGRP